jgi:hypothetical protein
VLLGKPGCGLCREMAEVAGPVAARLGYALRERDVRDDPELERRYVFEIPVLLLDGREVVRHRVTAAELAARLPPAPVR